MKKASILSLFMAMMLLLAVPFASADKPFKDVDAGFWGIKEINELSSKQIIKGYGDQSFRPNENVKRADAAMMIARALELDLEKTRTVPFKDVDSKHYAYNAIAAVYEAGIMKGSNNTFNPNQPLKRGEMAVILHNAFDLAATAEASFKDVPNNHFAYDAINYLAAHSISIGYADKTFKPEKPINRAEFAVLLSKTLAVDTQQKPETPEDLAALLAEIQNNEIDLESYEFTGNAEIGLTFPELSGEDTEDMGMLLSMFENIQVHLSGAYEKDPMHLEMLMEVIINEEMGLTLEMPIIMTQDAMYMKMGELLGGSDDKFIKMDLAELAEMSEQDAAALDMELQFELSKVLNEIMTKHLIGFYSEVDLSTVEIEHNPNAQKAIKFEVTNDSIESFVQILFEDMMPELLELMQNPQYAAAFGLTAEDLELLLGEEIAIDFESKEFQEMLAELRNALQINELSSHIVIDANNIALDHLFNADVQLTIEGETLGLKINALLQKQNVNEEVTFQFEIPADEDTLSMDDLFEYDEDFEFDEDYEYDEDFDFEFEVE